MGERVLPQDLTGAIDQSLQQILAQNSVLARVVSEAVRSGDVEQMPLVLAALEAISHFDQTASDLVRVRISEADQGLQTEVGEPVVSERPKSRRRNAKSGRGRGAKRANQSEAPVGEGAQNGNVFAKLLTERINGKLPDGKQSISKDEIVTVAKKKSAVTKAIKAEGISAKQSEFTRDEATKIVARVLTTPRKDFKPGDGYSRIQLTNKFGIKPKTLDELSTACGFDWGKNRTVDATTALQIRGLAQLGKPSARRKA